MRIFYGKQKPPILMEFLSMGTNQKAKTADLLSKSAVLNWQFLCLQLLAGHFLWNDHIKAMFPARCPVPLNQ